MISGTRAKSVIAWELLPFTLFYGLDRISKAWASKLEGPDALGSGVVTFDPRLNHGLVLGWLSELPPYVKYVTLCSLCALLFCGYFFYRFFVPLSSRSLRLGGALLLSGIFGNVTDRLSESGGVVDFISVRIHAIQSPVFNVADVVQLLAYGCILFGIAREARSWREQDYRNMSWVLPRFQLRFTLFYLGGGLAIGAVVSLLSYTFVRSLLSMGNLPPGEQERILSALLISLAFVQGCVLLILLAAGNSYSKRIAGPVFAIRRFLEKTNQGERGMFRLRAGDDLKEFEAPLNELNEKLNGKNN